jgi:hypothetical protein
MDRKTDVFTLLNATAITSSSQTAAEDVSQYTEALLLLVIAGKGGTAPTLDIVVQTGDEDDGQFHDHTTVSQITANGNVAAQKLTNIGRYLRLSYTLGGSSTPTYTVTAKLVVKN